MRIMVKMRSSISVLLAVGAIVVPVCLSDPGGGVENPRAAARPTSAPSGGASYATVSVEVGAGTYWEQPQWQEGQPDWQVGTGQIRICGPVGGMVQLLMDAWLIDPSDWKNPEDADYEELVGLYELLVTEYPELGPQASTEMSFYGLLGLPDLSIPRNVFEFAAAVPLTPAPGGLPLPDTVLYYYQPIVGTSAEGCRIWSTESHHWEVGTPGAETAQLWKGVAQADSSDPADLNFEALWQLALSIEAGPGILSADFGDPPAPVLEGALKLSMGITIQPLFYTTIMVDPGDYISEPVPGLPGVEDPEVVRISLGDPISFGILIAHPATSICGQEPCPAPPPPFVAKLPLAAMAGRPLFMQVIAGIPGATTLRLLDGVTGAPHDITLDLDSPGRYRGTVPTALGGGTAIVDQISTVFGTTLFGPQVPPISVGAPPGN